METGMRNYFFGQIFPSMGQIVNCQVDLDQTIDHRSK